MLGHSSPTITAATYSGIRDDYARAGVNTLRFTITAEITTPVIGIRSAIDRYDAQRPFQPSVQLQRRAAEFATRAAGHVFAHAYGIPMSQSWLAEFVASYLAYDTLRAISPEDAALWQEGAEASRAEPIPTHVSLEDFNRLYFGVGPDNYGWYQGRFQERVAQVQAKSGLGFIRALKSSGAASERDFAQQLQKLETLEPGFEAWAASLIALRPAASPR